jgi:AcrR family transcriptional regulator
MTWQRARQPEQKAVRRDAILNAARMLFSELPYEQISLNGIARKAGISKPNVYRYFSSREEIFLTIFSAEQDRFIEALIGRLKRTRSKDSVGAIGRVWAAVAVEHRTMLDLLPQLSTSMESNSSIEQIVRFKKNGFERVEELIETLRNVEGRLGAEQWMIVIQCLVSMMAGLWPLANPGQNVIEALRHPEVSQSPWEFEPIMTRGVAALINGFLTETKG